MGARAVRLQERCHQGVQLSCQLTQSPHDSVLCSSCAAQHMLCMRDALRMREASCISQSTLARNRLCVGLYGVASISPPACVRVLMFLSNINATKRGVWGSLP